MLMIERVAQLSKHLNLTIPLCDQSPDGVSYKSEPEKEYETLRASTNSFPKNSLPSMWSWENTDS